MQITNECCENTNNMLTLEQAHQAIRNAVSCALEQEIVSIYDCVNRVLANECQAQYMVPAFHNSAVDGYAVAFDDLNPTEITHLPVSARIPAGDKKILMEKSTAVRIFTGAPMPQGCDTVYMQEDVTEKDGVLQCPTGIRLGDNVRKAGEDVQAGMIILPAGHRIRAQDVALLAGQGIAQVSVFRKLKVGFFSSGNELLETGTPVTQQQLEQGQIFDSNRPMMRAMLTNLNVECIDLGRATDTRESVAEILQSGTEKCDMIMSTGGMSVGEEDHIKTALKKADMVFWKVAIKPGKPVGFGFIDGTPFIGFPGNPVSTFVVFGLIGQLLLRLLAGEKEYNLHKIPVNLGFDVKAKQGRREFVRVTLVEKDGKRVAVKSGSQGSGVMFSVRTATGLVEIPEDTEGLGKGDTINYIPFEGVY